MGYDGQHKNADRIYRVSNQYITSGKPIKFAFASPSLGPKLKAEYPDIESYLRINHVENSVLIEKDDIEFNETNLVFADSNFFNFFDYELLLGDKKTCLTNPYSIVLTEELANRYFGDKDPIGETLLINNNFHQTVTGVMADLPSNVHMPIKAIISYKTLDAILIPHPLDWSLFEIQDYTYVLVNESFSFNDFEKKWPSFYEKYCAEDGELYGQVYELIFRKLRNVHYNTDNLRFDFPVGNKSYIYAFISIGIFILILACINYLNLATSVAMKRSREIGIKKVIGSQRRQLIFQFLGESLLSSFIATLIAVGVIEALMAFTPFNQLFNIELKLDILHDISILFYLIVLFLGIGFISGIYPALYLSSFRPAQILSGGIRAGKHKQILRRLLVTFQFVISISVIIITLFMTRQINYIQNFDLGFKNNNIMTVQLPDDSTAISGTSYLTDELLANPSINKVTNGYSLPGSTGTGLYRYEGENGMEEHNFYLLLINHDYLSTLEIPIVLGRDFSRDFPSDTSNAAIVNEALVKAMGWEDPIGKKVLQGRRYDAEVIAVVKDFHYFSLHNQIEPLLIRLQKFDGGRLIIEINEKNIANTIDFIEKKWNSVYPDNPFQYSFLEDDFNTQYENDIYQNKLVKLFSIICIVISCLGLFGMSSYTSQRKTKEVGVRKAHGANVMQILVIIFREYIYLILIAYIISIPISISYIKSWLNNYDIKSPLDIGLFTIALLGAIMITLLTASFHSIKVARTNPAQSLRYE